MTLFCYDGLGDNVNATIQGNVYYSFKISDSLQPLKGVRLTIYNEKNQIVKTSLSDIDGYFSFTLPHGIYWLSMTKTGYQTFKLTNYFSRGDQVSGVVVVLEKGSKGQYYKIPVWIDFESKCYSQDSIKSFR